VLRGIDVGDGSGFSVSGAGDVNGDGIDDLIIGANGANEAYLVFGSASIWPASIELSSLNGSNGFVLRGINVARHSVSGAGDVNGDGIEDLIIGDLFANPNGAVSGATYVVFGRASIWPARISLSSLNGSNGFVLNGIDAGDQSGYSVSGAGDVNGDGIDDLIIGASGETYVVFGRASNWPASIELSSLNGSNGFVLRGTSGLHSVSGAGDVNGDGIDDLIIGAPRIFETYLVFGSASNWPASIELSSLDGSNGFTVSINVTRGGISVSGAGDVNGDGIDDLIIGLDSALKKGVVIVFFGSVNISAQAAATVLNGTLLSKTGHSVSGAGDVNGDGIEDLIIGAFSAGTAFDAGETYVVFGSAAIWPDFIELPSSLDGSNGFSLLGIDDGDFSGRSVSGAGDVNGDGIDDFIIGAPGADLF